MPRKKIESIKNIELVHKRDGHVHKYQLVNLGTEDKPYKVYKCMKVGCSHYHPRKQLVVNQYSICHKCGNDFVITADLVRNNTVKPKCKNCSGKGLGKREDLALERLISSMKI